MMTMKKYKLIEEYLDELLPNPICELNYFNDYSLLMAVMLSAQTKDSRVNEVTNILFNKYKSLEELKNADFYDLANIIKPLGSFNKKAFNVKEMARILITEYDGVVPIDREQLENLPGVGRKTANVFLSEFLHVPTIAVDTHVERVSKRLKLVKDDATPLIIEKKLMKITKRQNWGKRHLQLVLFGRHYCKAKKPECTDCKLKNICSYYKKK